MRRNFSGEWLETASKLSQEQNQRQCLSCRIKSVLSYQAPSTIQKCEVEARLFSRFGRVADEHLAKPRFKFPPVYGPLSSQCVRANDTLALRYDGSTTVTEKRPKSTRQPYRVNSRRKPRATILLVEHGLTKLAPNRYEHDRMSSEPTESAFSCRLRATNHVDVCGLSIVYRVVSSGKDDKLTSHMFGPLSQWPQPCLNFSGPKEVTNNAFSLPHLTSAHKSLEIECAQHTQSTPVPCHRA